jgi:hypothetical protein
MPGQIFPEDRHNPLHLVRGQKCPAQAGFRKNRSTSDHVIKIDLDIKKKTKLTTPYERVASSTNYQK